MWKNFSSLNQTRREFKKSCHQHLFHPVSKCPSFLPSSPSTSYHHNYNYNNKSSPKEQDFKKLYNKNNWFKRGKKSEKDRILVGDLHFIVITTTGFISGFINHHTFKGRISINSFKLIPCYHSFIVVNKRHFWFWSFFSYRRRRRHKRSLHWMMNEWPPRTRLFSWYHCHCQRTGKEETGLINC